MVFKKSLRPCALDKSGLSIGRVKVMQNISTERLNGVEPRNSYTIRKGKKTNRRLCGPFFHQLLSGFMIFLKIVLELTMILQTI